MGGNAFENTVRLMPAEYKRVKQTVLEALAHGAIALTLTVVASAEVLDKASFGDVDLYAAPRAAFDVDEVRHHMSRVVVQALRCPVAPTRNGCTMSFLTSERHQVDVAFTDAETLHLYATVHSNGDFCVLLQISLAAVGLRLTTKGLFLRDERLMGNQSVSKWDASFLLSLDPTEVGAFLGLPREAFDGRTSLAMEELFELVFANRFFDGGIMAAWTDGEDREMGTASGRSRRSRQRVLERPMLKKWVEWWRATGMASYGERKPGPQYDSYEGVCELAVEFFDKRAEFAEWEAKVKQRVEDAERVNECKSLLNFAVVREWLPDLTSMEIGDVQRKIRADHGQLGSVELLSWLRSLSAEDLCSEVLAVARQLDLQ